MSEPVYGGDYPCPRCGAERPVHNEPCPRCSGMEAVLEMLKADLQTMRSEVVFRVKTVWAHNGQWGSNQDIVSAVDPIQALQASWGDEDPRQLRRVEIEWLCPIDSVKKADESESEGAK